MVVAGSMIGPIVPPSTTLVVYAAVSQLSIIDLFVAGIIPGLLLAVACAGVILLHVFTRNLPRSRFMRSDEPILKVIAEGMLVAFLPVILLGGALSGIFTATEAGGVAVFYTLFLGCVVFRKLPPRLIWDALIVTARISASIYLVLAASARSFVRVGVCWRDGLGARAWGRVCRASGAVSAVCRGVPDLHRCFSGAWAGDRDLRASAAADCARHGH